MKSIVLILTSLAVQLVTSYSAGHMRILGSRCNQDQECLLDVTYSRCQGGRCACLPYYAEYNKTMCVQSTLLGFPCLVSTQCNMKVANSVCYKGVCSCQKGFLQFRRHTCLTAASPGDVCYSDAHCRLWSSDTHCDFLIPNLFGRCQCKLRGEPCVQTKARVPPTTASSTLGTTTTTTALTTESPTSPVPLKISTSTSTVTPPIAHTNPYSSAAPINHIISDSPTEPYFSIHSTDQHTSTTQTNTFSSTDPTSSYNTTAPTYHYNSTGSTSPNNYTTTTSPYNSIPPTSINTSPVLKTTTVTSASTPATETNDIPLWFPTRVRGVGEGVSVTLGYPCISDLQCQGADPASRCVSGVCDCVIKHNGSFSCSASNTGCYSTTFQCRSTGTCISWFFVCDGRQDCPDGSDEECRDSNSCPPQAFRCGDRGGCVSQAGRCDGVPDCPNGEDEFHCNGTESKLGCPDHTYQCGDGQCLPGYEFCNAMMTCSDGSDEPRHACKARAKTTTPDFCPFRCNNGRCRSDAILCSGRDGCGDGSDEARCSVCRCPADSRDLNLSVIL